jgi:hypothetical protein
LARRTGIAQPSISRIVKALEAQALIVRQGRAISLTETGRTEAERLDRDRSQRMERSVRRLAEIERSQLSEAIASKAAGTGWQPGSSVGGIIGALNPAKSAFGAAGAGLMAKSAFDAAGAGLMAKSAFDAAGAGLMAKSAFDAAGAGLMKDLMPGWPDLLLKSAFDAVGAGLIKDLMPKWPDLLPKSAFDAVGAGLIKDLTAKSAFEGLMKDLMPSRAFASALAAQQVSVSALATSAMVGSRYADLFAGATPVMSRIVADMGAMGSIVPPDRYLRMSTASDRVVERHGSLFAESVDQLVPFSYETSAARRLAWSTLATGSAVRGARTFLEQTDVDPAEAAAESALDSVVASLEEELRAINPTLVETLAGALESRQRAGPDWHRHMAQSLRVVFSEVLDYRAPRGVVTSRLGSDTQRARLQFVLGGTTAGAFGEAAIGMSTATWQLLSAEAKTTKPARFTQAGAVHVIAMFCHLTMLLLTAPPAVDEY